MAYAKTKKEMLALLERAGACREARRWVEKQNTNNAEAIWLRCEHLFWLVWLVDTLNQSVDRNRSMIDALRRHFVQTTLNALGAEFVHKHNLNKPLVSAKRRAEVADTACKLRSSYSDPDIKHLCWNLYLLCRHEALYILDAPCSPAIEARYIQDIKHCVSWKDACKLLTRLAPVDNYQDF